MNREKLGKLQPVITAPTLSTASPVFIPRVSSTLKCRDVLGRWKARLGIGRMEFRVEPGIYAVGSAGRGSPVAVTANYAMSFDLVRQALDGRDAFILVLDTKGINVWCAAGKGTFGTGELISRIDKTDLRSIVGHRDLILPQLGAVGVSAHEVKAATGFTVHYGPVDVADLGAYLDAGMKKTLRMSRVRFGLRERMAIVPIELVHALPAVPAFAAVAALLALPFDAGFLLRARYVFLALLGAAAFGIAVFPPLLPYLPFRAFVAKGAVLGTLWSLAAALLFGLPLAVGVPLALACVPVTAFLAMQYTGSSTYTNLSGASLEVKRGLPILAAAELIGLVGLVVERILSAQAA